MVSWSSSRTTIARALHSVFNLICVRGACVTACVLPLALGGAGPSSQYDAGPSSQPNTGEKALASQEDKTPSRLSKKRATEARKETKKAAAKKTPTSNKTAVGVASMIASPPSQEENIEDNIVTQGQWPEGTAV